MVGLHAQHGAVGQELALVGVPGPPAQLQHLVGRPAELQHLVLVEAAHLGPRLGFGDPGRHQPDLEVDEDHDDERQVEGTESCINLVADGLADDAVVRFVLALPAEDWRDGHDGGHGPHDGDHDGHALGRALHGVLEGARDDQVPVHADHAQVEDGGGAQQHVRRRPHVADGGAQHPGLVDLLRGAQRHDQDGHQQVRHRQRHDQQVGRRLQPLDDPHRDADERVADDGEEDEGAQDDGDQHLGPHLVR